MPIKKLFNLLILPGIIAFIIGCQADDTDAELQSYFPQKFTVDIPSSISRTSTLKSFENGNYSGKEIYEHLNNFIYIGESAAEFVEEVMQAIGTHELNKPTEFSYDSNDDHRKKNLEVTQDSEFEGSVWQYELTISDNLLASNNDEGKALQVFWNINPVKGIAIFKPENWHVGGDSLMENTIFKIEYSEGGEYGYDAHMVVSITGWEEDYSDRFHMDELKMFVGKSGEIIDVYGNSIHPDAYLLLDDRVGYCWAFVASGNENSNIAVAEVGLPSNTLDESSRAILLEEHSVENVFRYEFNEAFFMEHNYYPPEAIVDEILEPTIAPAFFDSNGFVQGGEAPSAAYDNLVSNIQLLTPYNPKTIDEMTINFK